MDEVVWLFIKCGETKLADNLKIFHITVKGVFTQNCRGELNFNFVPVALDFNFNRCVITIVVIM